MVDVGDKPATAREAWAQGDDHDERRRRCVPSRTGTVAKGDALQTARLAGIMAAKQTASLIPLCHPLPLSHIEVDLTPTPARLPDRRARADHRRRPASRWRR